MTSPQRRVFIKPTKPSGTGLYFELVGDDEITGGVGGWEDLSRPRRRAATEWVGTPAYTIVLPLRLDGMETTVRHDTPVEAQCRLLASWGVASRKSGQPPILRLAGPLRVPLAKRWVINELVWGAQIRNNRGRRIQQQVTVTLKEFVAAEILKGPAAKAKDRQNG